MNPVLEYSRLGIDIQPSGSLYKGICPFHSEKTPSFVVYPNLSYHCYGCRAHGTFDYICKLFLGADVKTTAALDPASAQPKSLADVEALRAEHFNDLYFNFFDSDVRTKKMAYAAFERLIMKCALISKEEEFDILVMEEFFSKYSKIVKKYLHK